MFKPRFMQSNIMDEELNLVDMFLLFVWLYCRRRVTLIVENGVLNDEL